MLPYTSTKPVRTESNEQLRERIPGWGADLDPNDRPAVPKERFDPSATGAHWDFPERQRETSPRERSIEHRHMTPVFGTSVPLKGLSGVLRTLAYARFSEGRAAHWLILIGADRVDAIESHLRSFISMRPDNPITESGVLSEPRRHGFSSRFGRKRADLAHSWMDPIIVFGPWVAAGGIAVGIGRMLLRRR
jgi:hypothetical protein